MRPGIAGELTQGLLRRSAAEAKALISLNKNESHKAAIRKKWLKTMVKAKRHSPNAVQP